MNEINKKFLNSENEELISLSESLGETNSLRNLSIKENKLDDSILTVLLSKINRNKSIEFIDMSSNTISYGNYLSFQMDS